MEIQTFTPLRIAHQSETKLNAPFAQERQESALVCAPKTLTEIVALHAIRFAVIAQVQLKMTVFIVPEQFHLPTFTLIPHLAIAPAFLACITIQLSQIANLATRTARNALAITMTNA